MDALHRNELTGEKEKYGVPKMRQLHIASSFSKKTDKHEKKEKQDQLVNEVIMSDYDKTLFYN